MIVDAPSSGSKTATVTAFQRVGTLWHEVFGPWTGWVGYNGTAPPGEKREGDGRTPSGTFGFGFFFGLDANPGVRFPWRAVTGPEDVWDDDSTSVNYNEWVDEATQGAAAAGAFPEPMDNAPAYDLGAVIGYNTSQTAGLGSAIFLHVDPGGPTAGCVALPIGELTPLLQWLDPAQGPTITIGVGAGPPS